MQDNYTLTMKNLTKEESLSTSDIHRTNSAKCQKETGSNLDSENVTDSTQAEAYVCIPNATENCGVTVPERSRSNDGIQRNKTEAFKKPLLLVGPRKGKIVGKVKSLHSCDNAEGVSDMKIDAAGAENETHPYELAVINVSVELESTSDCKKLASITPAQRIKEKALPIPYKEPKWSGIPDVPYNFEVLKDGKIIESIYLGSKPFFVIGRLSTCDIPMGHPTISRYHAVVQYRKETNEEDSAGFYVYDLGSTHGTFQNKYKIKSNKYVRIKVGHMLKFGNSTRIFILQGPDSDQEQESDLTITELREKRRKEQEEQKLQTFLHEMEEERRREREEEEGIDWGMGEDADEETDLSENPYAAAPNEDLYIEDPKKTLRGWFDREGYELEYNVDEKGFGQFLCTVELPIGNGMIADALVKGKKKESVVQCALEACRMLDHFGMLRQATHESRKRKAKNWEEDDFYDSDEDSFLDRTGDVEKKRRQRMLAAGKLPQEAETYDSLLKKYNEVQEQLKQLEKQYLEFKRKLSYNDSNTTEVEEDALDAYMTQLSSGVVDKKVLADLKSQVQSLRREEDRLRKLVNIAKPASLPELVPTEHLLKPQTTNKAALLATVKRKVKAELMSKLPCEINPNEEHMADAEELEEEEKEDEEKEDEEEQEEAKEKKDESRIGLAENYGSENMREPKQETSQIEIGMELSSSSTKNDMECGSETNVSALVAHSKLIGPSWPQNISSNEINDGTSNKDKRRVNRKEPKNEKAKESAKAKCNYDESKPDYSVWVPPEGQSGDGRTKLNEKYGY